MGVADPLRTRGPYLIENIFCPSSRWGVGGTVEILNWGSQPTGCYGSVEVPWYGAIPACPVYLPCSPENARPTARCVQDDLLLDHRLARVQSLLDSRNILRDQLVNQTVCAWDDLWDEPVVE